MNWRDASIHLSTGGPSQSVNVRPGPQGSCSRPGATRPRGAQYPSEARRKDGDGLAGRDWGALLGIAAVHEVEAGREPQLNPYHGKRRLYWQADEVRGEKAQPGSRIGGIGGGSHHFSADLGNES